MLALVDGDILKYSVGFACESNTYETLDGKMFNYKKEANAHCIENNIDKSTIEVWKQVDPIEHCLHSVKVALQGILEAVGATDHIIFLTGKGNFREEVATILPYKGNRSSEKPVHYDAIVEYLVNVWGAIVIEGYEADDALSLEMMRAYKEAQRD